MALPAVFIIPCYAIQRLLSHTLIPDPILISLSVPVRICAMLLINTRIWLLYYDYQEGHILASKPWQILINPSSIEHNWFLTHKRTLGDGTFILNAIIIPIVVCRSALYIFVRFYIVHQTYPEFTDGVVIVILLLISMVFIGLIWKSLNTKFPNFTDSYYIRHELRCLILLCVGMMVAVSGIVVVNLLVDIDVRSGSERKHPLSSGRRCFK